jgi:hypothetical protein
VVIGTDCIGSCKSYLPYDHGHDAPQFGLVENEAENEVSGYGSLVWVSAMKSMNLTVTCCLGGLGICHGINELDNDLLFRVI